jgi:hypothetical protein
VIETVKKAGRYEIVGELGRGAMGVVYRAVDPVIGRPVAVKTIRLSAEGTGLSRQELLNRFQTEARAAGSLTHPNIVVVYDAGEESGLFYITMELVEGKSLQAMIDGGQSFPLARTLRVMEQTGSALQFAHEHNIVHRDIKPANLMLTPDDVVKITDFGTAKILQFGGAQQTSHVMGTPSYMSPEQVKGRSVDGRSDIFSLGVMLYELVTGEKPFPGQNITTVIYKIVHENPVPPRQVDPAIHPGISSIIMKALEKEPDQRYQTCNEFLKDLRNYRSMSAVTGNPGSTMPIGGVSPATTVISANQAGRGIAANDLTVMATARSLASRTPSPERTPSVRRTGPVLPVATPPKKRNLIGTMFLALILMGFIAYGAKKIMPVLNEARQLHESQMKGGGPLPLPTRVETKAPPIENPSDAAKAPDSVSEPKDVSANSQPPSESKTADTRTPEPVAEKPTPAKVEVFVSAKAAEYKGRIEEAISERGLDGRAKVQATGNLLTLSGKLRPAEHGELLKFLRNAPSDVRVIDHVEYDDTPLASTENPGEGSHPVPAVGRGAIHVVTDVLDATAVLRGRAGRVLNNCQTPCSFNNLLPAQYSLEVQKDGYQPVQTALQVISGGVQDQKIKLESLAKGIFIMSQPAGADIFINGARQSGQTPVTLPLAAGQYNLVLRLAGFDAYAGNIQVKENVQTQMSVTLNPKSATRVAWAQVKSSPRGAEIFIDGVTTGQFAPARVQIPAGLHSISLSLSGYRPVKRTYQVSEGGTVPIDETLRVQ